MKAWKAATMTILVLAATVMASAIYLFQTGILAPPEVRSYSTHWGKVNEEETEILATVEVYNPYPLVIPVEEVEMEMLMNNITLAEGRAEGIEIQADSTSTINPAMTVDNSQLARWWYTHISHGGHTEFTLRNEVHLSILGKDVSLPLELSREVDTNVLDTTGVEEFEGGETLPGTPKVESIGHRWGEATPAETQILTTITFHNPREVNVYIKRIHYTVRMNGISMGEGEGQGITLPPESEKKVEIISHLDNTRIPEWWVSHVQNGESTRLSLEGNASIEVEGRNLSFPLPSLKKEFTTSVVE